MTDRNWKDCDILVHNGVVLSADPKGTVFSDGAIAIGGTNILEVGPSDELRSRFLARETIDARGAVVHPGFIDAHVHISQYSSRSVLQRMAGSKANIGDWKAALSPEDEHASASLAAIDYLRSGYTAFVDPGTIFEPDAVASAAEAAGIRMWLTDPYVADRSHKLGERLTELASPSFLKRWPQTLEEALDRLGRELRRNAARDGLVHAFIGIYGEETASPDLYHEALDAARRNGVQFQEHRGYLPATYHAIEQGLGLSAIDSLNKDRVLGPGTTFVHLNVVHAADVPLLAESGTRIVWCPYGQLQMIGAGGAEPRMVELHRAGCTVGLATDIPHAIDFDGLGGLAVANAEACGTPADRHEILRMRTLAAAETVGCGHEVGSLEGGKRADIVVRGASESEALGADPVWETAVLGLHQPPEAVIINGAIVLRNGRPLRVDPHDAITKARASVRSLLDRIGL